MKNIFKFFGIGITTFGLLVPMPARTQSFKKLPESKIQQIDVEAPLRFLASDELQGRRTGEQGNLVAARYLAEQLRMLKLKPANGQDYLLPVPLVMQKAAKTGFIFVGNDTLTTGKQFVILNSAAANITAGLVFVGYGMEADYTTDVKGKIVVANVGTADAHTPSEMLATATIKRKIATEKGAAALIEIFNAQTPWNFVSRFTGGEQLRIDDGGGSNALTHIWVNGQQKKFTDLFVKGGASSANIQTSGRERLSVSAFNVAGVIEGTDPVLKNEYVIVSAHFDHVGVGKKGGTGYTATDSIFNGARDNAFGTVALLTAAKALALKPGKRSVLVLAVTGEEVGLLGSRYYAEHPVIPLKQCVFDLNSDGAGYNDTSIAAVIGLDRTNCKPEIVTACKAFGLGVFGDPSPEQNLFDRSDNVAFAAKGIPAPTFTAGFKKFDESINKFYHQSSDNPDSVDFDYLLKFCQAYAHLTRLIVNKPITPQWTAGDKYEAASKALYGR
jgi:Peptidase family M28